MSYICDEGALFTSFIAVNTHPSHYWPQHFHVPTRLHASLPAVITWIPRPDTGKQNKGKAYTFQGRACTRNKRQPTETGSTGSTEDRLLFIIWGVRGLGCVTWSHLTGIQLAVNLLKSPLKLCWRRLISLPLPLKTMWSSPNSPFSHTT